MHSELTRARVLAQYRGHWLVALEAENRLVTARGRLTETPVTGDWVGVDEGGAIAHVFERSGTIVRRAPGERGGPVSAHVLAANVDLALVTEPLPDPKARRLERFAALAASGGVPVALVLTKADLDEAGYETAAALARRMGVADAVAVSAVTGEGMGVLRSLLTPGTTAVLLGASGTGKSTLVNALLGEERMKTNEVRASDRRGRHTTVTRELLALPWRRVPDRHARHPGRRPLGRHGRVLQRRRLARGGVPVRRLRPRHRAGLRRPRGARPRADRRLAQAPARARLGDRSPGRPASAGRVAQADHAPDAKERVRGIEPPSLAWEANVLAIGQHPRRSGV